MAVGQMLEALDFHLGPTREFAVVGEPDSDETRQVLRTLRTRFRPNAVLAFQSARAPLSSAALPLLNGKTAQGGVTTYICENFSCRAPLVGAAAVASALESEG